MVEDEGNGRVVQEEDPGQILIDKGQVLQIHPVLFQTGASEQALLEQPPPFVKHVHHRVGVLPQASRVYGQLIPIAHLHNGQLISSGLWYNFDEVLYKGPLVYIVQTGQVLHKNLHQKITILSTGRC